MGVANGANVIGDRAAEQAYNAVWMSATRNAQLAGPPAGWMAPHQVEHPWAMRGNFLPYVRLDDGVDRTSYPSRVLFE